MTPYNLTPKQLEALKFLVKYINANWVAPTYDEIALHLGLKSKAGVHRLVLSLAERGWIKRTPGHARSITVLRDPKDVFGEEVPRPETLKNEVPFIGKMSAYSGKLDENWPRRPPPLSKHHASLLLDEIFSHAAVRDAMPQGLRDRVSQHVRKIKLMGTIS